jgi:Flp pilus assembly protein TadD
VRTQPGLDDSIRLTVPESLEAMAMPIERALQAEPDLAEAHIRASIYYWRTGDSARARDHLARAQALAPNDPLVLASFTWTDGESEPSEEQVSAYRKIIAVDPLSLLPRYNLVNALTHERRLPEARRELEAALSLFPEASAEFATPLAVIELLDGNFVAAAAALRAVPDATDRLRQKTALLAMAWHGMGLTDRSVDARRTLERAHDEWAALRVAEINAYTGDSEEAFAWLREATHRAAKDTDHRDFWLDVQDSMFLNELKGDPRWRSLKQEYLAPPQ